jgi:hypothetical protein
MATARDHSKPSRTAADAFAAIEATLPEGRSAARPDGKGGYRVTLDRRVLDKLGVRQVVVFE